MTSEQPEQPRAKARRRAPARPLRQDPGAITRAREAKRWTQDTLARAVGISPGHMSEIEKGTRGASLTLIDRLAEALECPVSVIERGRPEPAGDDDLDESGPRNDHESPADAVAEPTRTQRSLVSRVLGRRRAALEDVA